MEYDNRYNGVLAPNRADSSDLIGPICLEDTGRDDLVALVVFEDSGKHTLSVHERRKDRKGLKRKPIATGYIKRVKSTKGNAPVARGTIISDTARQPIVIWSIETAAGRRCQVKPDGLAADSADVPDIPA